MTVTQGDRAAAQALELMTFVDGLGWVVKCSDAPQWTKLYLKASRELAKESKDPSEWAEA